MPNKKDIHDLFEIKEALSRARKIRMFNFVFLFLACIFAIIYFISKPNVVYINDSDTPLFAIYSDYLELEIESVESISDLRKREIGYAQIQEPVDRNCGEKFAILVHEPHARIEQEEAFFELLDSLQSNNPEIFRNLVVFLEGQFSHTRQQNTSSISWNDDYSQNAFFMIKDSKSYWDSNKFHPLNNLKLGDPVQEIIKKVDLFTGNMLTKTSTQHLENMLLFYSNVDDGPLKTQTAVLNRISELANDVDDPLKPSTADRLIRHFTNVTPKDTKFAKFLIHDAGLRGPHAYELAVEGFQEDYPLSRRVDVYGLDDLGHYLASCLAVPGCLGENQQPLFGFDDFWLPIQPARDSEMADNVVTAQYPDAETAIPIVAASIGSHLPLVRELLCQAEYDSVSLSLGSLSEQGTTPGSAFFSNDSLKKALRAYEQQLPKR